MAGVEFEQFGAYVDEWARTAPRADEVDDVSRDALDALVEAGMVQYNPDGWDFKLHEKNPDAPKAKFKLMIRKAPGVDTNPAYYDRFVLPSVLQAGESELLDDVDYVVGYPNAGTPIARAFVRLAHSHLGTELTQLQQSKIVHPDGTRELGDITSEYEEGKLTLAVDDTATGGYTKVEGWQKIVEHRLGYAGLALIVERDPLGTALVREHTDAGVYPSLHWLTLVQHAGESLNLPDGAVQSELSYPSQLFEWNVVNGKTDNLPSPEFLT